MSNYRSAQGRVIDMNSMALKNEKVRAVGNMKVNARGDVLDQNNNVIQPATIRVAENYSQSVVSDAPRPPAQTNAVVRNNIDLSELSTVEREFEGDDEIVKKD